MMRAGSLRDRVTLQAKSVTRDAMGGEVITWTDQASVWANAKPLRGREYFAAHQEQAEISIKFTIRYLSGVTSNWRVLWRGQQYDVVEPIDVDARKVSWELLCRTVP